MRGWIVPRSLHSATAKDAVAPVGMTNYKGCMDREVARLRRWRLGVGYDELKKRSVRVKEYKSVRGGIDLAKDCARGRERLTTEATEEPQR